MRPTEAEIEEARRRLAIELPGFADPPDEAPLPPPADEPVVVEDTDVANLMGWLD